MESGVIPALPEEEWTTESNHVRYLCLEDMAGYQSISGNVLKLVMLNRGAVTRPLVDMAVVIMMDCFEGNIML